MAVQGPFKVDHGNVFPHGAFAKGVEKMRDFDRWTKDNDVQAQDRDTGLPIWVVSVVDNDPEARDGVVRVKVAAKQQPALPGSLPNTNLHPVEFEGLRVMPYVNAKGRLAYSLRADSLRAPSDRAGSVRKEAA